MLQVLYRIPIKFAWAPEGIPIFGYGMMLFVAFLACTWLAGRRARQQGINPALIQDLAIWLFIGGLLGSRVAYLAWPQADHPRPASVGEFLWQLPRIWDGGVVFYGGAIGGAVGYGLAYVFLIRKTQVPTWKLADIIAPSIAVGLCLGRIGCFLNGCCFGAVACGHCPGVPFPLAAPVRFQLVAEGLQTAAGFTLAEQGKGAQVDKVEAGSPADRSGLLEGDRIVNVNNREVRDARQLTEAMTANWPRGKSNLQLTVERDGRTVDLPPFVPWTLRVQPTQLYESISMLLLFLLLLAYSPFRRHDGELIAVLMVGYGVHRYLNEILRHDSRPIGFEVSTSVVLVVTGILLLAFLRIRPPQYQPARKVLEPAIR